MAVSDRASHESASGKTAALITAAGISRRFTSDTEFPFTELPRYQADFRISRSSTESSADSYYASLQKKEFYFVQGRPILEWTVEAFIVSGCIDHLAVTYTPGTLDETREILHPLMHMLPFSFVPGGDTRQESVCNGLYALQELNPEIVLIHDGARPGVLPKTIRSVAEAARKTGGALPVVRITDALKKIDEHGKIEEHADRNQYVGAQTPQGFRFPEILEAHMQAKHSGKRYFDDTEIFTDWGGTVICVPGSESNRKITYKEDVELWI